MTSSVQQALQALLAPAFEIRRELRGGGMSRVFVAYEPSLKREVAVKVLPPDLLSATSIARFRQEIEVTARLQHPHILPVVTTGGTDTLIYYVMPYVAGGSLRERLQSRERPGFAQGVRLTEELLAAISVAHKRGIVHRDIKPGNVLLSEGHAMLADFGIARVREAIETPHEGRGDARTTSVASPEAYRAPERPRDSAADLYALAVLSFEMLTGTLPLNVSESAINAALLDANREVSPLRVRAVAAVLARALSREPEARFPNALDFHAALAATEEPLRASARHSVVVAASLLIVAAGSWWVASRQFASAEAAPPGDTAAPIVAAQGRIAPADGAITVAASEAAASEEASATAGVPDELATAPATHDSARAELGLALREAWIISPRAREGATRAATRALVMANSGRAALDSGEAAIAEGIVALGRGDFPAACAFFERAQYIRDDYDSWMGIGDCRLRDTVVVQRGEAMGFRASYHEAARAYVEAARRTSAGHAAVALHRLSEVAFIEQARVRRGWIDNQRVVLGRPFAVADSFTFDAFEPGQPRRMTPDQTLAHNRALAMSGAMLRPALVAHTRREPTDMRARLMLVELLEVEGNIDASRGDGITALGEIETARGVPADRYLTLRMADAHLRLLLRAGRYEVAGRLLDSLLAHASGEPRESEAAMLFGAAMLGGRVSVATRLLELMSASPGRQIRMRDGGVLQLPAGILRPRAAFTVQASLGVCDDDVRSAPPRLLALLESYFQGSSLPRGAAGAFLERPVLQALPCIGPDGASVIGEPTHPLGRLLLARTDGDRAQWTGRVAALRQGRNSGQLFFESPEHALLDAIAYLAEADSAGARATLSRMIQAVPVLPPPMLSSEFGAGPLVRGMAMRAELAAAEGDSLTARQLAAAVASLWRNADSQLQPVVERMRALSGDIRP